MINRDNIDNSNEVKDLLNQLEKEKNKLVERKEILKPKPLPSITNDEIPFEIPTNWMWVRLSDISIIQEGPGIRKSQYSDSGVQFLTVTNILEGCVDLEKSKKYISIEEYQLKYKHFTINNGDIVSSCSGATWGKTAIYNLDDLIILNTSTLRLRFFGDKGNNKYLYFLTKAVFFKKQLSVHSTGQQANFGNSHYSLIAIPLPPLSEQQRIVSILDEAFSSIEQAKENLQRNLQNAKELFQSEMNSIFTNKGEDWEEKPLGEIATFRNGMNFTKQSRGASIKIVGVKDFQKHFWINFDNLESVTLDGELNDLDSLRENDILAVRSNGNPELIGRCILAGSVPEKTSHSGFTIRIRLNNTGDYFAQYLCHFLKSEKAKRQLIDGGTGISIKSLNQGTLSSLVIPFPSLSEQQKIVQQLDKLSEETKRLEAMYQQKLDNLEELKKSILQKAFSGEL